MLDFTGTHLYAAPSPSWAQGRLVSFSVRWQGHSINFEQWTVNRVACLGCGSEYTCKTFEFSLLLTTVIMETSCCRKTESAGITSHFLQGSCLESLLDPLLFVEPLIYRLCLLPQHCLFYPDYYKPQGKAISLKTKSCWVIFFPLSWNYIFPLPVRQF